MGSWIKSGLGRQRMSTPHGVCVCSGSASECQTRTTRLCSRTDTKNKTPWERAQMEDESFQRIISMVSPYGAPIFQWHLPMELLFCNGISLWSSYCSMTSPSIVQWHLPMELLLFNGISPRSSYCSMVSIAPSKQSCITCSVSIFSMSMVPSRERSRTSSCGCVTKQLIPTGEWPGSGQLFFF